jgi:hypothetical protein
VLAAGLGGAAALTGVGLLGTGGRSDTGTAGSAGHEHATKAHLSRAQLTAEVTQAVDSNSGDIFAVHARDVDGQFSSTHWLSPDGNTLRVETFNPDGSPRQDESVVKEGDHETVTDVDYATTTWWSAVVQAPQTFTCAQASCASGKADDLPPGGMVMGAPTSAAGVTWLLDQAGFTKTGQTETVDGVANAFAIEGPKNGSAFPATNANAFSLQTTSQPTATSVAPRSASPGPIIMWIDPTTNLPVQVVMGASNPMITNDVSWLTPTTANDALLTVTPPAGFGEVPIPAANAAILVPPAP